MMKKRLILLCVAALLMFAGCGEDEYQGCDSRDGTMECPYEIQEGSHNVPLPKGVTYFERDITVYNNCELIVYDDWELSSVKLTLEDYDGKVEYYQNIDFDYDYNYDILDDGHYVLSVSVYDNTSTTISLDCY